MLTMMTERLRAVVERVETLSPEEQDRLARAFEEVLRHDADQIPPLAPEVRDAVEAAMREHAATLEYLKDR
jgi:hypothetical protein